MKTTFLIVTCLLCLNSFCQTTEPVVEEKSSNWIKVVDDPIVVSSPAKKRVTVTKRKPVNNKSVAPKQDATEEFEKTNNQVNRFKKQQKG